MSLRRRPLETMKSDPARPFLPLDRTMECSLWDLTGCSLRQTCLLLTRPLVGRLVSWIGNLDPWNSHALERPSMAARSGWARDQTRLGQVAGGSGGAGSGDRLSMEVVGKMGRARFVPVLNSDSVSQHPLETGAPLGGRNDHGHWFQEISPGALVPRTGPSNHDRCCSPRKEPGNDRIPGLTECRVPFLMRSS
jgi:hypothetical protein